MSDDKKKLEKEEVIVKHIPKAKMIKFEDSECTAMRYAAMTGLNKGTKFWLGKKYDSKEIRTAKEWTEELLKEGAIDQKPEILKQMVPASK